MQYSIHNRRRLRPITGEPKRDAVPAAVRAEGSGAHRRPPRTVAITEIVAARVRATSSRR